MKKALIISVTLNLLIVLFIAGKRYYYSSGPGAGVPQSKFYDLWNSMRSSMLVSLPIDSSDIVFIGNSLTEAFPVSELFGKHVKNRGIGGNTTLHVLNRIDPIANEHPKKIFIEIGVNDLNFGYSVESAFSNLKLIISKIKTSSPSTKIYIQALMPTCMSYAHINSSIGALNKQLKQYCDEQGIVFIDLHTPLLNGTTLDSLYTSDGIHLNGKGYQVWQQAIQKYLGDTNRDTVDTKRHLN